MPGHAGLAAACLATCAMPLAAAGLAAAGSRRAVLLAVAAGLADAGIAVVTMAFSHVVSGGLTGMAGSWATYALMLGGPCSLLLTQSAYQAGRPMITLPVISVVTPVASLAAGNLLLGESASLGVLSGAVAALAVLVTSAGLVVLARLTTGQPGPAGNQGSSVALPAFLASGSRSGPDLSRRRPDCLDELIQIPDSRVLTAAARRGGLVAQGEDRRLDAVLQAEFGEAPRWHQPPPGPSRAQIPGQVRQLAPGRPGTPRSAASSPAALLQVKGTGAIPFRPPSGLYGCRRITPGRGSQLVECPPDQALQGTLAILPKAGSHHLPEMPCRLGRRSPDAPVGQLAAFPGRAV